MKQLVLGVLGLYAALVWAAPEPTNSYPRETRSVELVEVDGINAFCAAMIGKPAGTNKKGVALVYAGCASYLPTTCIIYVDKTSSNETWGHELRHCFKGDFHAGE